MQAAPPVSVQGAGGQAWRAVQSLLPALATATFGVWCLSHVEQPVAYALPPALAVAAIAWRLARAGSAVLAWDGQRWAVDGEVRVVQVMVDLDRWLLLHCRPEAVARGGRWLAITATEAGAQWPLLRAALYAHVPRRDADGAAAQPTDV